MWRRRPEPVPKLEVAMEKWVTRISRALMMGLAWAGVWVPAGVAVAGLLLDELDPEHIGGPLYSGFLCGSIFSAVAGIAAGRRRLSELSVSWAAVLGAVSGLLGWALWFLLVLSSVVGDTNPEPLPWQLIGTVVSSLTVLSGMTGVGSVWVARLLEAPPRSSAFCALLFAIAAVPAMSAQTATFTANGRAHSPCSDLMAPRAT